MKHLTQNDIGKLDHLYKINLINSCSGYKSANLIGTKSKNNIENVAVFSSVTHLGSAPPLFGFFLRPNTVPRNTYENIKETGVYTINSVHAHNFEDAHHTSAKYDKTISEFDVTNLKSEQKKDFYAPFVHGSPIQMAMKFVEEYHIKANNTILLIGEVQDLYFNENLLENDGYINLSKAEIISINGLDGYTIPSLKTRLAYQRPKQVAK